MYVIQTIGRPCSSLRENGHIAKGNTAAWKGDPTKNVYVKCGGSGFGILARLASGTALSRFAGNTVISSKCLCVSSNLWLLLRWPYLHACFYMSTQVYEMLHRFSYVIELLCYLVCLQSALNFLLPLTVASTIPDFFPSSNRTQLLGLAAAAPLNASALREYTCSESLYGLKPNEASCMDAIRQVDARDGKEQVWKQRGYMGNYDIGLPRSYWSCTSESRRTSLSFH